MSDKSKLVYICSPYATGNVQENVDRAREYCKLVLQEGFIPVAPHLLYPQFLCDEDEAEREQGLACGLALLEVCAEVWVFGQISKGMLREIDYASENKIPVFFDGKRKTVKEISEENIQRALLRRELTTAFQMTETQGDINQVVTFLLAKGVREISRGKWIDKFCGEFRCNVCGEITSIDTETDFPNGMRYRFCPWCGAEMDIEDNNED